MQMWAGRPSPRSADVAGMRPIPVQMWEGRAQFQWVSSAEGRQTHPWHVACHVDIYAGLVRVACSKYRMARGHSKRRGSVRPKDGTL